MNEKELADTYDELSELDIGEEATVVNALDAIDHLVCVSLSHVFIE